MDLKTYLTTTKASRLAALMGVTDSMISQWKTERRHITAETALRLEAATKGAVTRSDLRPDLWPPKEVDHPTGV